jgi:transposase-like protein
MKALQQISISKGAVHCPSCTHNVDAEVLHQGRRTFVKPGQKCSRCSSTLDAAYILQYDKAA